MFLKYLILLIGCFSVSANAGDTDCVILLDRPFEKFSNLSFTRQKKVIENYTPCDFEISLFAKGIGRDLYEEPSWLGEGKVRFCFNTDEKSPPALNLMSELGVHKLKFLSAKKTTLADEIRKQIAADITGKKEGYSDKKIIEKRERYIKEYKITRPFDKNKFVDDAYFKEVISEKFETNLTERIYFLNDWKSIVQSTKKTHSTIFFVYPDDVEFKDVQSFLKLERKEISDKVWEKIVQRNESLITNYTGEDKKDCRISHYHGLNLLSCSGLDNSYLLDENLKSIKIKSLSTEKIVNTASFSPIQFFRYNKRTYFLGTFRFGYHYDELSLGFVDNNQIYYSHPRRQCRLFDRKDKMDFF